MKIRIFNGAKVTCPTCDDLIAIAKRTIMIDVGLKAEDFLIGNRKQEIEDPATCLSCGAAFVLNGKIHLDGGWV